MPRHEKYNGWTPAMHRVAADTWLEACKAIEDARVNAAIAADIHSSWADEDEAKANETSKPVSMTKVQCEIVAGWLEEEAQGVKKCATTWNALSDCGFTDEQLGEIESVYYNTILGLAERFQRQGWGK